MYTQSGRSDRLQKLPCYNNMTCTVNRVPSLSLYPLLKTVIRSFLQQYFLYVTCICIFLSFSRLPFENWAMRSIIYVRKTKKAVYIYTMYKYIYLVQNHYRRRRLRHPSDTERPYRHYHNGFSLFFFLFSFFYIKQQARKSYILNLRGLNAYTQGVFKIICYSSFLEKR